MIVQAAAALTLALACSQAPATTEQVAILRGTGTQPDLLVRHEPGPGRSILYIHGATFPSGLSIAYKIDGRSWMDDLRAHGFDVWAFDFAGFGGSAWPRHRSGAAGGDRPIGRAKDVQAQILRVADHIRRVTGHSQVDMLAHSWGTIPATVFAGRHSARVGRLVLFGPPAPSNEPIEQPIGASILVTRDDQWAGFASGSPGGVPNIAPATFDTWVTAYLATDPNSTRRSPPAVAVPGGPAADLTDRKSTQFRRDLALVRVPTLIIRGEWDSVTTDTNAAWLVKALEKVPGGARDVKLARGGHRMHLEENRQSLFDSIGTFLIEDRRTP